MNLTEATDRVVTEMGPDGAEIDPWLGSVGVDIAEFREWVATETETVARFTRRAAEANAEARYGLMHGFNVGRVSGEASGIRFVLDGIGVRDLGELRRLVDLAREGLDVARAGLIEYGLSAADADAFLGLG